MRTKIVILFGTAILFAACVKENKQNDAHNTESIIMDTIGNTREERNMKTQFGEYLRAYNSGNFEKALYYIYPDLFEYISTLYPEENLSLQTIKDSIFIKTIKNLKTLKDEKKMVYKYIIGDVSNSADYKNAKFYVILASIEANFGKDKQIFSNEVVAISTDKGTNWKFFQIDPESPEDAKNILRMKFPSSVIRDLFKKSDNQKEK